MHDPNLTDNVHPDASLNTLSLPSLLPYIITLTLLLLPLTSTLRTRAGPPKGCRRLGATKSNIDDEYDPKYTQGVPSDSVDADTGLPAWRIKALFTYPIKSCKGVELESAEVITTGLKYDRLFCFAEYIESKPKPTTTTTSTASHQEPTGQWTARTLRDRHFSRLALLRPEIWIPDPESAEYDPSLPEIQSSGVLIIHYPRTLPPPLSNLPFLPGLFNLAIKLGLLSPEQSIRIPLTPPPEYPLRAVKIWKDTPHAHDYSQHIPASLRRFLADETTTTQKPLALFRASDAHNRVILRNAPSKETLGFQTVTGFQDAYPLHLLNLASVRDVARRCAGEIPRLSVRRFRANVLVQGPVAFEEDGWRRILVGGDSNSSSSGGQEEQGVEIYAACRTLRCRLPNVDPDTGVRHRAEPDRTLKAYRRIDRGDPTNACLGMQLVPAVRNFTLRVNDPISVLETGDHCYIKMLAPGEVVEGV
ncbi:MOSC domain protein [Aspergillus homomorphus CBS 101889]|uniref:MOSC domain protein n=1 Tax=Aspergillus homomorphus (strain CBS 101889) TaxID=1450537 RepID=A0A395HLU2_ASPHC|nr:MOSC domain protein [Aspergillus homomorphus CBS 101889]RAL08576.1 MOSC domain protein [Aspergillus homomorphus CBS 101889]